MGPMVFFWSSKPGDPWRNFFMGSGGAWTFGWAEGFRSFFGFRLVNRQWYMMVYRYIRHWWWIYPHDQLDNASSTLFLGNLSSFCDGWGANDSDPQQGQQDLPVILTADLFLGLVSEFSMNIYSSRCWNRNNDFTFLSVSAITWRNQVECHHLYGVRLQHWPSHPDAQATRKVGSQCYENLSNVMFYFIWMIICMNMYIILYIGPSILIHFIEIECQKELAVTSSFMSFFTSHGGQFLSSHAKFLKGEIVLGGDPGEANCWGHLQFTLEVRSEPFKITRSPIPSHPISLYLLVDRFPYVLISNFQ